VDSRRLLKDGKLGSEVLKVVIDVLVYKGLGRGEWFVGEGKLRYLSGELLKVVDFIIAGKISKSLIEPIAEAPPDTQKKATPLLLQDFVQQPSPLL